MATVTVYRASSPMWAARTFRVDVDGAPGGTLRGRGRLGLELTDGPHTLTVTVGDTTSRPLAVTVTGPLIVVVGVDLGAGGDPARHDFLTLAVTDRLDERGPTYAQTRRSLPPVGYRGRDPRENAIYVAGLAMLVIGLILRHSGDVAAGAVLSTIGVVVVLVMFLRGVRLRR